MDYELLASSRSDREIRKKVVIPGDFNVVPYEDAKCNISITEVSYAGPKSDCNDAESQYFSPDFNGEIVIGDCDNFIDKDVEILVQQMCKNEVCLAEIVYKDEAGNLAKQINFQIQLLDVTEEDLVSDWDWKRLFKMSLYHKDRGAELVKNKRIKEAFRRFSKAFKFIVAIEPIESHAISQQEFIDIMNHKIKLYNNLALCQLHFNEYKSTLELCDKLLVLEPNNVKALYRRSCAHAGLKLYERAWTDIQSATNLDPHDKAVQQKVISLRPIIEQMNVDYTNLCKKMFGS